MGSDEGVYAWVVANYALGTLGGDPLKTTGIIELGGASAQVTFVSSEPVPTEFSRIVQFGNTTYNLYSHSLLHFGQNAAFVLFRNHLLQEPQNQIPVLLVDIHMTRSLGLSLLVPWLKRVKTSRFATQGNFSECRSAALAAVAKGKRASVSNLMTAGQQFCEEDWQKLKMKYHSHEEGDLSAIASRLHILWPYSMTALELLWMMKGLGLLISGDIPLDWALGAFILQSTVNSDAEHPTWIAAVVGSDSSTLLLCLLSPLY
ncbi:putative apyrase 6 [Camellia lanceoleosa]|uniref:Apyrase 6 n=1 Tax=Camellia lanceoleosa TaxID=1840588 RepID=A0ACC0IDU0_9ERIC|nr:putative apyrase 6 [Camellia lanceoleosa]